MKIRRVDSYDDPRFSRRVLGQHGCFLINDSPYEVEIISDFEAVVRGEETSAFPALIDEFRFYTPHITVFYNSDREEVARFPAETLLTVPLKDIQPSQFYVDEEKVNAVKAFIHSGGDIIIQVTPTNDRFISLDGHTRLYYAAVMGWTRVRAVAVPADSWVQGFVDEAIARNIRTPYDLQLLSHDEYEIKWNKFCDDYFAERSRNA